MTITIEVLHGYNDGNASIHYAYPDAEGLEGSAKLTNKFACMFLRQYDTIRNRGTNFVTNMANGSIRTDSAVVTNFTAAVTLLLAQIGDQSTLPTSEQLSGATLLAHSLFSDTLTMTIELTTPDGSVNFVMPLKKV